MRQLSHVAEELSVDGGPTAQQQLQAQQGLQLQLQQLQALHHLHAQQQQWMQHLGSGQGSAAVGAASHPAFAHDRLA